MRWTSALLLFWFFEFCLAGAIHAQTVIAVVDSGVDATHPDLAGQLVAGFDFTDPGTDPDDLEGHGTAIAGIVVANGGVTGVCTACRVMPLRVASSLGAADTADVAAAIDHAVANGADAVLVSTGSVGLPSVLATAVANAESAGVAVVAPAGNTELMQALYPAALPTVLSVAALDDGGDFLPLAAFTGRETVHASGDNTVTTRAGGGTVEARGSSVAAAKVAGVIGLLLETNPALTPFQLRQAIAHGAAPMTVAEWEDFFENGVLDQAGALARSSSTFADVAITRVSALPDAPLTGQANTARVRVVNQGNIATGAMTLTLTWNGAPVAGSPFALASLARGQSHEEDVPLPTAGAAGAVPVVATVSTLPGETETADNSASIDVAYTTSPVHDLELVVGPLSEPVVEAGSMQFDVTVRNRGNQDEPSAPLEMYVDGVLFSSQQLALPPGAETVVNASWTIPEPRRAFHLRVVATAGGVDPTPGNGDWAVDFGVGARSDAALVQYSDTGGITDVVMDAPWRTQRPHVPVLFFFPEFHSGRIVTEAFVRNYSLVGGAPSGGKVYQELHDSPPPGIVSGGEIVGSFGEDLTGNGALPTMIDGRHGFHYIVRIPRNNVGVGQNVGTAGVHYLWAQVDWSRPVLGFEEHWSGSHYRVLRVHASDLALPKLDADDRYYDAHVHTIAEATDGVPFGTDVARKNFGGPIAMLLEASHALGLTETAFAPGFSANWQDFSEEVVVTDHNVFYSTTPNDSGLAPSWGPTAATDGHAGERSWYRQNLGDLAGEEVALAAGSNQTGSALNFGYHFLLYDAPFHVEGPWHGGGLLGTGANNPHTMLALLQAVQDQATSGFGYAAHPNTPPQLWPPEYFDQAIGLPVLSWNSTDALISPTGDDFTYKGAQVWNGKGGEVALFDGQLYGSEFRKLNPFFGGPNRLRFRFADWDDDMRLTLDEYRDRVSASSTFAFANARKDFFLRKLYMVAGTDAHGDFNYTDDLLHTGVDTVRPSSSAGSVNSNAYGRVRTYALSHDRPSAASPEATAVDAFQEGNTVLTDGPVCRLRIDSDGRHDPSGAVRWHDATNVYENPEGRIGGWGDFDGGGTVLVPFTSGTSTNAFAETLWAASDSPNSLAAIANFTASTIRNFGTEDTTLPAGADGVPSTAAYPHDLPGVNAIQLEGVQQHASETALDERCITNPVWTAGVLITVKHPNTCPIPAGALEVQFHFPISMDREQGVYVEPLDGAGNSTGSAVKLQAAPGWQERAATRNGKFVAKNTFASIPCPPAGWDADAHAASTSKWSYVVYMKRPDELHGNTLNGIGRTFSVVHSVPTTVEVDYFPRVQLDFQLDDGVVSTNARVRGEMTWHVGLEFLQDFDMNGREEVPAEMVQLELRGVDATLGDVIVRRRDPSVHPFQSIFGPIEEQDPLTPGTLDVPPFVTSPAGLKADSTFGAFVEVEIPGSGLVLHNHDAIPLTGEISHKPPIEGDLYGSLPTTPLFDENDVPTGSIGLLTMAPVPAPSVWQLSGSANGGTVDYSVDGASGQLVTVAGDPAESVAAGLAAAINDDPAMIARGVSAISVGSRVIVYGDAPDPTLNDAGLTLGPPAVPSLSPPALGLLAVLLFGAAVALWWRRGQC